LIYILFKKATAKLSGFTFGLPHFFFRVVLAVFCWFGLHKVCLTFILRPLCAFCMTDESFFGQPPGDKNGQKASGQEAGFKHE